VINKVYKVTIPASALKKANPAYTSISNQFEIHFNSKFQIEETQKRLDFEIDYYPIKKIANEKGASVDVIGLVLDVQDVVHFGEKEKRSIKLGDQTGYIIMALWGNLTRLEIEPGVLLKIKQVGISRYGGLSLSTTEFTQIDVDKDGKDLQKSIEGLELENIGIQFCQTLQGWDQKQKISLCAEVEQFFYSRQMVYEKDGKPHLRLRMKLSDGKDNVTVVGFDEVVQLILGITALEVKTWIGNGDFDKLDSIFQKPPKEKFLFTLQKKEGANEPNIAFSEKIPTCFKKTKLAN